MKKETLRMQKLAGIISESKYSELLEQSNIIKEGSLNENEDLKVGEIYTASMPTDSTGKNRMDVKVKFLGKGQSNDGALIVTPIQDVKYQNSESGQENVFEKNKQYNTEAEYLK